MSRFWFGLTLVLICGASWAQDVVVPDPPELGFKSHYLVDFDTGTVLAQSSADEPLPPASLTKLMTAYVVF